MKFSWSELYWQFLGSGFLETQTIPKQSVYKWVMLRVRFHQIQFRHAYIFMSVKICQALCFLMDFLIFMHLLLDSLRISHWTPNFFSHKYLTLSSHSHAISFYYSGAYLQLSSVPAFLMRLKLLLYILICIIPLTLYSFISDNFYSILQTQALGKKVLGALWSFLKQLKKCI